MGAILHETFWKTGGAGATSCRTSRGDFDDVRILYTDDGVVTELKIHDVNDARRIAFDILRVTDDAE